MENIACPRCGELTITPKDRIKTGKWLNTNCSNCGSRLCANPVVLALLYFVLLWDIFFFGFMAYHEKSWIWASVMLAGWLIMEFFIYYTPLSILKSKPSNTESG